MNCPQCGGANPDGKRFCGDCGAPLPLICAACGSNTPPASPATKVRAAKLDELEAVLIDAGGEEKALLAELLSLPASERWIRHLPPRLILICCAASPGSPWAISNGP